MKRRIPILMILLTALNGAFAIDARKVMSDVLKREDGDTEYSIQVIATCSYRVKGNKMQCRHKPRIKTLEQARKDYGKSGKDRKSVFVIQKPASEQGIGFLQYDYESPQKETDQWMYLSALGKIKRIVSGNSDEPKKGSLFGSEFSYEDTEQNHLDDYTYKLLREESFQGRPCWVIQSRPTAVHARKSNYSKSEQWVDKESMLILKGLMYDRQGRLKKQLTASNIEYLQGVWVARKINMNNIQTRRITTMKLQKILFNGPVADDLLTRRTLTDQAFRERQLMKLRSKNR